jgi:glutathione S-transferase
MESVQLYYWPIRGLKEPIVYLLEYLEIEYKFKPVKDNLEWEEKRKGFISKGYPFATLPIIEMDGKVITEALPIMTALALKAGKVEMAPNEMNFTRFMELYGIIADLFTGITQPAYASKSLEAFRQTYLKACQLNKRIIEAFDRLVGKQKWLLGNELTILDFKLAETLDKMKAIEEDLEIDIVAQYVHLDTYLGRFLGLPAIKAYRTSDKFQDRPFNGEAIWQ